MPPARAAGRRPGGAASPPRRRARPPAGAARAPARTAVSWATARTGAGRRGAASTSSSKPKSGAAQGGASAGERAALANHPARAVPDHPGLSFNLHFGPRNRQSDGGLEPALEIPDVELALARPGPVLGLAPASEDRGHPPLLARPLARGAGHEGGADLEEADVGHAVGPVGLDQADQPGQEPAPEPGVVGRERVEQPDAVGLVRRTHREAHDLVEALGHESAPDGRGGRLLRRVRQGADPIGPELRWKGVVAVEPRDLLDQVDLALEVAAASPARRPRCGRRPACSRPWRRWRRDGSRAPATATRRRAPGPPARAGGRSAADAWGRARGRGASPPASRRPSPGPARCSAASRPRRPSGRSAARTGSSLRC